MKLSQVLSVSILLMGPLSLPADEETPRPRLWSVLVAADVYPDPAVPSCPGARDDATTLRRWLNDRRLGGWPASHVLLMTRFSQRQHGRPDQPLNDLYPSRENLQWVLREWLPARLRPNDIVLFAWFGQAAGFGPRADDRPGTPGRFYLLPLDTRASDIEGTGWAIEDDLDPLGAPGQNPVLLWLDTALNGRAKAVIPDAPMPDRWLNTLVKWPSISAWLTAEGEPAREGVFVRSILSALGTPESPRNLLACLDRLRRDPSLSSQGFRTAGGLPVDLTLWSAQLAPLGFAPPAIVIQNGHSDRVLDLALFPDGSTCASAGADSTVKLWRMADRMLLRTLPDHAIGVTHLALSADGRRLVSGDGQGRVLVWALPGMGLLPSRIPLPHQAEISALQFIDDGSILVSLDASGTVYLWDVSGTNAVPIKLIDHVNALASGGGHIAVSIVDDEGISAIRTFSATGKPTGTFPGPGGLVTGRGMTIRENLLALADQQGHVLIHDLNGNRVVARYDLGSRSRALAFVGSKLAVGGSGSIQLVSLDGSGKPTRVNLDQGDIDRIVAALDGRRFAALTEEGELKLWNNQDPDHPREFTVRSRQTLVATAIAFHPNGRSLIVGCQGGEIRTLDLTATEAREGSLIPSHRGQVARLAASPDGQELLQITRDGHALLWDLRWGRNLKRVPGNWISGLYSPDGASLAMIDENGDLALLERATLRRRPTVFRRPSVPGGGVSKAAFRQLAISPDGRLIAAGSELSNLACVWELATGTLVRTIREHPDGLGALDFSTDSKQLLTAGPDGIARVWPLDREGDPLWTITTSTENPVTAAVLDPLREGSILTGHANGAVLRWTRNADGTPASASLARLEGSVRTLAVTADRHWLAAAGDDKSIQLVALQGPPRAPLRLAPRHDERVTALVAWPRGALIASGSEDTTVRFWRVDEARLLGTLSGIPESGDWIAFAPSGRFDSSPGAERRVTWAREGRVFALDQFYERYRSFRLTDYFRRGEEFPIRMAYQILTPPSLALDPPPPQSESREVDLRLTVGEGNLTNLRLYLNGVPVRAAEDFQADPTRSGRFLVRAPLRKGLNSLFVMAGRSEPGSVEGRSNVVEIVSEASDQPSRIHVIAIGINNYPKRPLKFSARDAEAMAEFLHEHPADSTRIDEGIVSLLRNDQVSTISLRRELTRIRLAARPEDTVVVFLAGHTDVRKDRLGRERFCLLLPTFPFADGPSPSPLASRGSDSDPDPEDDPATIIPYASIYQDLIRIPALQRVVILDACSAEAVRDDPLVRRIQENVADKVDDAAQLGRTSYLLASRRNEPALEVDRLGHGLLTHVLLRGMGADQLQPDPGNPLPLADVDADGFVTTTELREYVDEHLPALAALVAPDALRSGAEPLRVNERPQQSTPFQIQAASDTPFPLIRLSSSRSP